MAASTKRKSKRSVSDIRNSSKKLWRNIDAQRWYALLREVAPDRKWVLSGQTIKGKCPYHDDTNPSFILNFQKGYGKCHGSCAKYVSDLIQLFTHLRKTNYLETFIWLDGKLGFQKEFGNLGDEVTKYHQIQEMKKAAAIAFNEVVQEYVRESPEYLGYLKPGLVYLETGRRIPMSIVPQLPVSLFAKPEHVKKYLSPEFHADYDTYFNKANNVRNWGSPIFHYNDEPGNITRFKIRRLESNAPNMLKVFEDSNDSSRESMKRLCTKDMFFVDDEYCKEVGLYGLHHYMRGIGHGDARVYITEGEFDALSIMVGQITSQRYDLVMLASSGSGVPDVGFLCDMGIRTVYLVQDAPAKNGDAIAKGFLENPKNFSINGATAPLEFKIFTWPAGIQGGDLDEAVELTGFDKMNSILYSDRNKYFVSASTWVEEHAKVEIERIKDEAKNSISALDTDSDTYHTELRNIETDRDRDLCMVAQDWLKLLHDPSAKLVTTQHLASATGLDIAKISAVQASIYRLDTFEGAKNLLRESLKEYIRFLYLMTDTGGKRPPMVWSTKKEEIFKFPYTDDARTDTMANILGQPFLEWVKSVLGENSILDAGCKEGADVMTIERKKMADSLFMFKQLVESFIAECPSDSDLVPYAQGIHMRSLPNDEKHYNTIYVVNGSAVFKGTYAQPGITPPLEWEKLEAPVHHSMKFLVSKADRWSHISEVADLYAATSIDLKKLYNDILRILGAWEFEHDDVNKAWLASWILSVPTMAAVDDVNLTYITGESASGKTSLLKGLLGGVGGSSHEVEPILEAAKFTADATRAWMQQEMDRSTLLLVIDEAETGADTAHNNSVMAMQEMMLSIPHGGSAVRRGGVTQENRKEYILRMPIVMGGIHMNPDQVFLSRVFIIYTKKDPKRTNCSDYIREHFTYEEIVEIRKQITVALLPYVPHLSVRRYSLRKELAEYAKDLPTSGRFIDNMLTQLAVYEMIDKENHDPIKLFAELVEANRGRLESIDNVSYQSELIDAAVYSQSVKYTNSDGVVDMRQARSLIRNGEIAFLNSADCGVYCIPERRWVVIVWRVARHAVLRRTKFERMTDSAMKESVSHNKYVIHDISMDDHNYIVDYLRINDMRTPSDYTVLSLEYLMNLDEQEKLTGIAQEKKAERMENMAKKSGKGNTYDADSMPEVPIDAYDDADGKYYDPGFLL